VREVGVAAMLDGLDLNSAHLGVVWSRLRDQYPHVEEYPPAENEIERFDQLVPAVAEIKLTSGLPVPRLFMLDESRSNVVQLQSDRIGFNWRKQADDVEYPRFGHVRDSFESAFDTITATASSMPHKPLPEAYQCEVVYLNEVPAHLASSAMHGDPDPVIRMWKPLEEGLPGPAEDVKLVTRHRLTPDDRTQGARLIVSLEPVVRVDSQLPVYLLSLTVRGAPAAGGIDAILGFLDLGHETIVRAFAGLTTADMHDEWGRLQ
jgi:uncharacterized protein (TIGR04255 family)